MTDHRGLRVLRVLQVLQVLRLQVDNSHGVQSHSALLARVAAVRDRMAQVVLQVQEGLLFGQVESPAVEDLVIVAGLPDLRGRPSTPDLPGLLDLFDLPGRPDLADFPDFPDPVSIGSHYFQKFQGASW